MSIGSYATFTLHLDHDFNHGRNENGFHEVLIDQHMEDMVRRGQVVTFGDSGYRARGRIRCLVAVIEEIADTPNPDADDGADSHTEDE